MRTEEELCQGPGSRKALLDANTLLPWVVPAPTANHPSALCLYHTPSRPHFLFPPHPHPPTPHSLPSTGIQKVCIIPLRGRKREACPPLSECQGASVSNIFSWLSLAEKKCSLKKRCLLSSRERTERDGSLNASLQPGGGAQSLLGSENTLLS